MPNKRGNVGYGKDRDEEGKGNRKDAGRTTKEAGPLRSASDWNADARVGSRLRSRFA
ncbi:hypothetical protein PsJ27TS7_17430 [Paenibacillus dendritiformis]